LRQEENAAAEEGAEGEKAAEEKAAEEYREGCREEDSSGDGGHGGEEEVEQVRWRRRGSWVVRVCMCILIVGFIRFGIWIGHKQRHCDWKHLPGWQSY
jgi:hypothetical protein